MDIKSSRANSLLDILSQYSTYLWCVAIGWSVGASNFLMVISTVLVLLNIIIRKKSLSLKGILFHPLVILYLLFTCSILWSLHYLDGLAKIKTYLPILLFPIVLQYWQRFQPEVIIKGIRYLSCSLIIGLLIVFMVNLLPVETILPYLEKLNGIIKPFPYSDKNLFGWYVPFMERINYCNILAYSGIALFFFFLHEKKTYYLLVSIFFLSSSFWMGARASMIATIIIIPLLIFSYFRNQPLKNILLGSLISVIVISTGFYLVKPNIDSRIQQTRYELNSLQDGSYLDKDYQHFTTLIRFISWKNAVSVVKDKPFTGHGIGDYPKAFEKKYHDNSIKVPVHYHSQWLYFSGVFGIAGLIVFLMSYFLFAFQIQHRLSLIYFTIFSIYTAIVWIFDTLLLQKEEMMAFALFLSFTVCLKKSDISYT